MTIRAADNQNHPRRPHNALHYCLWAGVPLALLLSACVHHGVSVIENGSAQTPLNESSSSLPPAGISFSISPFDKIRVQILPLGPKEGEVVYQPYDIVKYEFSLRGPDYHILLGDQIAVHFTADPNFSFDVTVRPDGKITLGNNIEVIAAGKTPPGFLRAHQPVTFPPQRIPRMGHQQKDLNPCSH